jgi:SAM-dependent methyltransferase
MNESINPAALKQLASHHRRLSLKSWFKGLPYERCAELSWIVDELRPRFDERLRYLDIGTGESPLPTFLSRRTDWDITCLDKCAWVRTQRRFVARTHGKFSGKAAFRVIETDLLNAELAPQSFDLITCVSVIEHLEGSSDASAMAAMARLLAPAGTLILTTLINEPWSAEFYVKGNVYGDEFRGAPVFYQRHYNLEGVARRLVEPSGLIEKHRVYFGDYGFQCFERVLQKPWFLRGFYSWTTPWLAARCLSYRSFPVSRKGMRMNTSSGLILVLGGAKGTPATESAGATN